MGSRSQAAAAGWPSGHQHGEICKSAVLLNPFCPLFGPFNLAKVLALKATILLLLQVLVFLAVSGGIVLAAGGAALVATQQRRPAAA